VNAYARNAARRNPERDQLIAEHIDMARRIALKVARRLPHWVTRDDLIAAAMIGLTEAADRFDAERGEPFVGFAAKRIRGAVLDELRRGDLMSRRARSAANRLGATIAGLEQKLGRSPEDEEIAKELGVGVEEYRDELAELSHVSVVDVDAAPRALIPDGAPSPADEVERRQLAGRLREGLGKIPERDALLLSLYYVEDLHYVEIGEVLGVSESRVCQLHSRALARLRAALEPEAA
jgi:RNA polymerase sigma factor FliA